jgi:hypothetical protein
LGERLRRRHRGDGRERQGKKVSSVHAGMLPTAAATVAPRPT